MDWKQGNCEVCGRETKYLCAISEEDQRLVCYKCSTSELGCCPEDYEANLAFAKLLGLLPEDVDTN